MTRRIKRTENYELTLQIGSDQFVQTPRASQRNWLLNRMLKECSDELEHLNRLAKKFVSGVEGSNELKDRTQRELTDKEIMEDWQIPVMRAMADIVTEVHGDILEIGFGRGIGSDFIQRGGVNSHTIIECNDSIVQRFAEWRLQYPDRSINLLHGMWQDVIGEAGLFDGIFFHTYPLNTDEIVDQVVNRSTFAEHFFTTAHKHLKPGGVFSYLTNESDSLSRTHQRDILRYFSSFSISLLKDLNIPEDTSDAMWADSMVIIRVVK